jgi:hypothetical protein
MHFQARPQEKKSGDLHEIPKAITWFTLSLGLIRLSHLERLPKLLNRLIILARKKKRPRRA